MVELKVEKSRRNPAVILYILIPVAVAAVFLFLFGGKSFKKAVSPAAVPAATDFPSSFDEPVQVAATGGTEKKIGDYNIKITYKYSYELCGLAVSTKKYPGTGIANKLAPKDVAMAWGDVARNNDKINFHWSQSGRWYMWQADSYEEIAPVGGVDGVNTHSANNHLIAADDSVADDISRISAGDYVIITGYLVDIYAENSSGSTYTWNSSTSRNDTGDGACEVIYVTGIRWL
ncbi:MAG: hypothetical protein IKY00_05845 [Clostridia bacterium]|nr:hypothetical protein [Clostridia bacterium]